MRLAILTDIHANRAAFEAVLADLAARQVDRIGLLGDVLGYGPDPAWCLDRAMALVDAGAFCILGNHDAAAVQPSIALNVTARRVIRWTAPLLTDRHRAFISALPLTHAMDDILFVHASANAPADWIYIKDEASAFPSFRASEARVILAGHRHVPAVYSCDIGGRVRAQKVMMGQPLPLIRSRRWLAVVGAVGQPRDGVPQAGYAILDTGRDELTLRRVPYDVAATVARLRAAGLPESLAMRLTWGA